MPPPGSPALKGRATVILPLRGQGGGVADLCHARTGKPVGPCHRSCSKCTKSSCPGADAYLKPRAAASAPRWPLSVFLIFILRFYPDKSAHPWMDTALEPMNAHAQSSDLDTGTGSHKSSARALLSRGQAYIEWGNASAAKSSDLSEGMASAALVPHSNGLSWLNLEIRRAEPPRGMSNGRQ